MRAGAPCGRLDGMVTEHSRPARIAGYLVAAAVNAVLLWVAWRLLDWGWPPFLTDGWRDVLPILSVSLLATIVVNLGYVAYDARWLRSAMGIVLLAISVAVTARLLQVFPFDLAGAWETVVRVLLVLALVGSAIGIVVNLVTLVRVAVRPDEREPGRPTA